VDPQELNQLFSKLGHNILLDCKKKDISKIDRAKIIEQMIKTEGISLRELARQLEISHSTLQDWHMYSNIDEAHYEGMKSVGYNDKQIYKMLRDGKTDKLKIESAKTAMDLKSGPMPFDDMIKETNKIVRKAVTSPKFEKGPDTVDLLKDLVNNLNRLISRINLEKGNGSF
jgi:hypothetical protein